MRNGHIQQTTWEFYFLVHRRHNMPECTSWVHLKIYRLGGENQKLPHANNWKEVLQSHYKSTEEHSYLKTCVNHTHGSCSCPGLRRIYLPHALWQVSLLQILQNSLCNCHDPPSPEHAKWPTVCLTWKALKGFFSPPIFTFCWQSKVIRKVLFDIKLQKPGPL